MLDPSHRIKYQLHVWDLVAERYYVTSIRREVRKACTDLPINARTYDGQAPDSWFHTLQQVNLV